MQREPLMDLPTYSITTYFSVVVAYTGKVFSSCVHVLWQFHIQRQGKVELLLLQQLEIK